MPARADASLTRPETESTRIRPTLQKCFVEIGDVLRVGNAGIVDLRGKQRTAKSLRLCLYLAEALCRRRIQCIPLLL